MTKEEMNKNKLLDELSKMSPMVIATAYLHAINYTLYGEDVTEKWLTAIQNASALEKAYNEGYHDAMEKEPKTGHWEWVQYDYNPKLGNWHCSECRCIVVECVDKEEKGGIPLYKYCPQCGAKMQEAEIEG